jgi:predicted phage-related endonuclease|tara:strand:+ start:332 stop:1120 length:789 start_codon:yes stop_codon:yes gene_type:complete
MERKGFIGGSDCVQIMQGNWYELWQVKCGIKEPDDLSDNLAVQLGIHTEEFNLKWFEKEHGITSLTHHQFEIEKKLGIKAIPCKGTVDAVWNKHIVEAKHTNSFNKMSNVIEYYMPQLQFYMELANADGAYLSVIFGNSDYQSVRVERNKEYFGSMWAVVSDFWEHVQERKEPVGNDMPTISIDKIPLDEMVARDASTDNMFMDNAVTYVNGYEHNKSFERAKKDLKAMVGDNEREVYCDQLTVKRDKRGSLRIHLRGQNDR